MYAQNGPGMIPPPAMSPRAQNFAPIGYGFGGPSMQHPGQQGGLAPSALPRNFSAGGSPFDPQFNRGIGIGGGLPPVAPIGPPPKAKATMSTSPSAPSMLSLAPGTGRRGSILTGDPGPVARPIAPIARPTVSSNNGGGGEGSSGPGSPNKRSPSPKGVLGSSALVEDDDEVVISSNGRRGPAPIGIGIGIGPGPIGGGIGAVGQGWGPASPRSAVGENRAPWGAPGAPPGFGSPRPLGPPPPIGSLNTQHHPQQPIGSLWGNAASATPGGMNQEWHPPGNYFPGPFVNHNTASPPPNSSS